MIQEYLSNYKDSGLYACSIRIFPGDIWAVDDKIKYLLEIAEETISIDPVNQLIRRNNDA